jgi:hypothetical protein
MEERGGKGILAMRKYTPFHLRNEKYCECIHWAWTPEMNGYDQDGHHPGCSEWKANRLKTPAQLEDEEQIEYVREWSKNNPDRTDRQASIFALIAVAIVFALGLLIFDWR